MYAWSREGWSVIISGNHNRLHAKSGAMLREYHTHGAKEVKYDERQVTGGAVCHGYHANEWASG